MQCQSTSNVLLIILPLISPLTSIFISNSSTSSNNFCLSGFTPFHEVNSTLKMPKIIRALVWRYFFFFPIYIMIRIDIFLLYHNWLYHNWFSFRKMAEQGSWEITNRPNLLRATKKTGSYRKFWSPIYFLFSYTQRKPKSRKYKHIIGRTDGNIGVLFVIHITSKNTDGRFNRQQFICYNMYFFAQISMLNSCHNWRWHNALWKVFQIFWIRQPCYCINVWTKWYALLDIYHPQPYKVGCDNVIALTFCWTRELNGRLDFSWP